MRFVQRLSKETLKMLQRIEKESQKHEVRQRAKCIRLSYQRYAVAELTANNLYEKQEEWQQKGLTLFFLPTYSPHLNLIEILWHFIKYQWLQPSDYDDWNTLVNAVENLLKYFGDKYIINFA